MPAERNPKDELVNINHELAFLLRKRSELLDAQSAEECKRRMKEAASIFDGDTYDALQALLKDIEKMQSNTIKTHSLLYSRKSQRKQTVVDVNGNLIGDGNCHFIMGPCSVESVEQVNQTASEMKKRGLQLLRGGAFKPRTSPYDFQGLGMEGLRSLSKTARDHQMAVVTEIMSPSQLEEAYDLLDVIQIGARNMQNFELLKAVGRTGKPVLLKRGLAATIKEFMLAAEYILREGNNHVILCERGIRTFGTETRNTLDISSVPILKQETHLPVIVDVAHSTGRKDLFIPAAKAAVAIGADGVMAEVHPNPVSALSDAGQQMNHQEFHDFMDAMEHFLTPKTLAAIHQ
ncbi:bifunctional 3-deoxy-7-phosphoheptulonate synthase/chorismate mutase [Halobacillus salinarum]|uniref:Bifunctional 3-deoxy-7-phosphoheptulonate synthase/chorismate mutase n=1 Tax=Halobacillus salinarum TaxID=2932257 RepID=A0ABY4EDS2_9BACI|nr:bifunctional 3-deoxy-7-phosphoheptulonate synthase/chorismate mutase [Halobacillus salinarum]